MRKIIRYLLGHILDLLKPFWGINAKDWVFENSETKRTLYKAEI